MSLKKNFGKSTAWMSAAASGNSIVSFIIFIILSRLLTPDDIGLVAFALILVELGKIVVNAAFPQAIVRHAEWDQTYASTCFYLNFLLAILITLLVFFIGSPLTAIYYDPRAQVLLEVLSIIFFLEGIKAVHEGKLKREFNFRTIAIRTVLGSVIGGVVGIWLALRGWGVWALVWQQLINQIIITLVTFSAARWVPSLSFSWAKARELIGFSTPLLLAQIISNFSSKVYEVLVGLLIGPAALGFFRVGGRALFILQDIVAKPFEQTLLPALARMSERKQQGEGTLRTIRMSAYFTFPIFFGAAAIGPEFIIFAFTEKWALSGQIMTILALGVAPLVIGYQINAALTATDNSAMVMKTASINFILNCLLGFFLVPYGVLAAACGFTVRTYVGIFLNFYFFRKVFDINMTRILKIVAPALIASLTMLGIIYLLKHFLPPHVSMLIRLLLLAGCGALSYILLMTLVFRQETKNFLGESIELAPNKAKPLIIKLQRLLRLA
jgi:O-antigen/teichoic acid export membrane protein